MYVCIRELFAKLFPQVFYQQYNVRPIFRGKFKNFCRDRDCRDETRKSRDETEIEMSKFKSRRDRDRDEQNLVSSRSRATLIWTRWYFLKIVWWKEDPPNSNVHWRPIYIQCPLVTKLLPTFMQVARTFRIFTYSIVLSGRFFLSIL